VTLNKPSDLVTPSIRLPTRMENACLAAFRQQHLDDQA
jgi:hypothetical protein